MEIVSTTTSSNKEVCFEDLVRRKAELKIQIAEQKAVILNSTQRLTSPTAMASSFFKTFNMGLNMVDGVVMGYKIVRSLKRLFGRRR